jgi:LmbE family N-acetylglucosaminyl deacetylase
LSLTATAHDTARLPARSKPAADTPSVKKGTTMAKVAFAIAAHPDDIEFLMAGTLILLKDAGYAIHYMNLANGCCGTTQFDAETIARIRREEARAAAESIGAVFHESLCDDLAIFYDRPTLARVASVIRSVQPEILLTHAPSDYMEDHMNTCRLAVTAAFSRGMPNFPVDPPRAAVNHPMTVYHAQPYSHRDPLGRQVEPELFVDVSLVLERKVEMLARHVSQKRWLDESQGLDSYLQTLRDLDEQCGRMSGMFAYAEGWRRHLHLGFCGPHDDPLRLALQDRILPA